MAQLFRTTGNIIFNNALSNLDHHMYLAGKAKETRRKYSSVLCKFILHYNCLPEDCTKQQIINFFISIRDLEKLSQCTIRQSIFGIKYYLRHIADRMDLFERIPNPRKKHYDIEVLTASEMLKLISACRDSRQLLIIQLLYETGLRIRELVLLKLSDIDLHFKTLVVRKSKNNITRTINLGSKILFTLKRYLKEFKSIFSDTLLANKFHPFMPLSTGGISWVIKSTY